MPHRAALDYKTHAVLNSTEKKHPRLAVPLGATVSSLVEGGASALVGCFVEQPLEKDV